MSKINWSNERKDYEIVRPIVFRRGVFVDKQRCTKNGLYCATKQFHLRIMEEKDRKYIDGEIEELRKLSGHENIVEYYTSFFNHERSIRWLVMEWLDTSLHAILEWEWKTKAEVDTRVVEGRIFYAKPNFFEKDLVASILIQVLNGLKYIHNKYLMHRDIKPASLLINENGSVKIADFGRSKIFMIEDRQVTVDTIVISHGYTAPEILLNVFENKDEFERILPNEVKSAKERAEKDNLISARASYGAAADIWSWGMVFYVLFNGSLPIEIADKRMSHKEYARRVLTGQFELTSDNYTYDSDITGVIIRCLEKDPSRRPKAEELMGFSFFSNTNNDKHFVGRFLKKFHHKFAELK